MSKIAHILCPEREGNRDKASSRKLTLGQAHRFNLGLNWKEYPSWTLCVCCFTCCFLSVYLLACQCVLEEVFVWVCVCSGMQLCAQCVKFHQRCCNSVFVTLVQQFSSYHTRELALHLGKEHNLSHVTYDGMLSFSLSSLRPEISANLFICFLNFLYLLIFFSVSIYVVQLHFLCLDSLIYTYSIHALLSSSFPSSLCLMGLFYWCPSYELSWAGDVNYRTMIGPLLNYAWTCPAGEKMAYSQEGWMEGWRDE